MFASLAKNTLIAGGAFLVTGLIPLLLVPVLIQQYGMAQYGVLVIARLLLPTGALAFLDFGNSETAGFAVAKARHDGDWAACGRLLGGLLRINLIAGLCAGAAIYGLAAPLANLFGVDAASRDGFLLIVTVTAVAMPVLLASLAAEGVLRGFEAFREVRSIDVATTLAFALMAYAAVSLEYGFAWVGMAYVAYGVLRAMAVIHRARALLRQDGFRLGAKPGHAEWRELRVRCLPLGANRLIGVGQAHASPLLIGALLGPAAVGLFDVVVRIPRFLKIVTGVLNTAVLPIVMRLDQANDHAGVRRLYDLGLLGVLCLVAPLVAWCITFSEAILRLWVSEAFSHLWPWQALMFLWPLINSITSFTCGSLLGRPLFVRALNWIVLGQIVAQITLSLLAMQRFGEQGFVIGQIAALLLSFPLQMWLVAKHSGIHPTMFKRHAMLLLWTALASAVCLWLHLGNLITGMIWLIGSIVAWVATMGVMIWLFVFTSDERKAIVATVGSRFKGRRSH